MVITDQSVEQRLKELPPEKLMELAKASKKILSGKKFIPSVGPQLAAYQSKADILLYGGQPGGGKGLRKQSLVLTPYGWQEIGKLKVGSAICATDGTIQIITAYYERGIQPLFKLKWSDGSITICDSDHIWLCKRTRKNKKSGNNFKSKHTALEIYHYYRNLGKFHHKICIPVISKPCIFNVHGENKGRYKYISRVIPPYVLGVIQGSGDINENKKAASLLKKTLTINEYKKALNDLGISLDTPKKRFIPRIYLFSTVHERWELLRGLMDTAGYVKENGNCYFSSLSKQLTKDVKHLARSLGAVVTSCKKKTSKPYELQINICRPERMFSSKKKIAAAKNKKLRAMHITLDNIEPFGKDETVCIAVSNPNSLFITEDFIVTHNSGLIIGLALNEHDRSLIVRRQFSDLQGIIDGCKKIVGDSAGFVGGQRPKYDKSDGGVIHFEGMSEDEGIDQGKQGTPHDFIGIDEGAQLPENKIRMLMGWNRPVKIGQRCRMVIASNPPLNSTGYWMAKFFAAWLDPSYPNPAKHGELRWFIINKDDESVEVESSDILTIDGNKYYPHSRTFIPARVEDNPFNDPTEYHRRLQIMPEPQRSILMSGNFLVVLEDAERQVIPSDWVRQAQARWNPKPPITARMTSLGVDVAAGGKDSSTLARHYNGWFAEIIKVPGSSTPLGSDLAALVVSHRRDNAVIVMDFGGGFGGAPALRLKDNGIDCVKFISQAASNMKTKDGKTKFVNYRAAAWWKFREALDPDQPGGSPIALPPDQELFADLTAPLIMDMEKDGIQIEPKDKIRKLLGRSPDKGDCVVMAWNCGKYYNPSNQPPSRLGFMQNMPKVIMSYPNRRNHKK